MRNMLAVAGQKQQLERPIGRPSTDSMKTARLDTNFNKHWPGSFKAGHCHEGSARGVTWGVYVKFLKSDEALCVDKM